VGHGSTPIWVIFQSRLTLIGADSNTFLAFTTQNLAVEPSFVHIAEVDNFLVHIATAALARFVAITITVKTSIPARQRNAA
jgi:hypothetical protein